MKVNNVRLHYHWRLCDVLFWFLSNWNLLLNIHERDAEVKSAKRSILRQGQESLQSSVAIINLRHRPEDFVNIYKKMNLYSVCEETLIVLAPSVISLFLSFIAPLNRNVVKTSIFKLYLATVLRFIPRERRSSAKNSIGTVIIKRALRSTLVGLNEIVNHLFTFLIIMSRIWHLQSRLLTW